MAIAVPSGYCGASLERNETAERMTGSQSRLLNVGARVCWRDDKTDSGTVTETTWSVIILKWDSRGEQSVPHNDMDPVSAVSRK